MPLVLCAGLPDGTGVEMKPVVYASRRSKSGYIDKPLDRSSRVLEKTTRQGIDKILKKHGVFYFAPVNFGMGKAGVPDVIACVNGRFVGIEAKGWKTGHILTQAQKSTLADIEKSGGIAFVANPFNLEDLDDLIEGLK